MVHGFIVCPGSASPSGLSGVVCGAGRLGKRAKRKRPTGCPSCETRVS